VNTGAESDSVLTRMTTKEKRILLALAEGFVAKKSAWDYMGESGVNTHYTLWDNKGNVLHSGLRDYFGNLNDIRAARKNLLKTEEQQTAFISHLREFDLDAYRGVEECVYELVDMDARRQAEALGWTLGLWEMDNLKLYELDYSVRIVVPSGIIQLVTSDQIRDSYARRWCRLHNANPEGRFAMDMQNRMPSTLKLWLEYYVTEAMFPGSVLLVQETDPLEYEKNGGCPVCRSEDEHMHAMAKCVACGFYGDPATALKHECKCQR